MSDLISRSKLLKHSCRVTEYDEAGFSMEYNAVSVEDIKNAPAAYDVNKAIEEMHNELLCYDIPDDFKGWWSKWLEKYYSKQNV